LLGRVPHEITMGNPLLAPSLAGAVAPLRPTAAGAPSPLPRPPPPRLTARAYAALYGLILWPTWERARSRATLGRLALLESMQWRTPEEIERFQLSELRALLAHAGAHVPYWRETFRRLRF
jgi:hypothetical protein